MILHPSVLTHKYKIKKFKKYILLFLHNNARKNEFSHHYNQSKIEPVNKEAF